MTQPALYVFAKQPIPGQVKTRLQPEYGPGVAAEIAALLIRETVALAVSSWPGPVYLCGAPDADHPLFRELSQEHQIVLRDQGAGDLGARMHRALTHGIEQHGAAGVIGCDVPHCPWDTLDEANGLLARRHDVIGPTEDGGYYFIGLARPVAELFADMPWSTSQVYAETRRRADRRGIEFSLLGSLRDIDTAADLWLIAQRYEPLRRYL